MANELYLNNPQNKRDFTVALTAACVVKGVPTLTESQIDQAVNLYTAIMSRLEATIR